MGTAQVFLVPFRFKMVDRLLKEQRRRTGAWPLQGTPALTWQQLTQQ